MKSVCVKRGITYFYNFEVNEDAYLYLKIRPKKAFVTWKKEIDFDELSMGFFLVNTENFAAYIELQNKANEANRRITFAIIGGLGIISLISLLIASYWKKWLFFYYFVYGFSPLVLLAVKEVCFFILINSVTHQPYINTFSRTAEFMQLVSLAAYVLFVTELLDIKSKYSRLFKVMKLLAIVLILQGIVEVVWLLTTFNIAGYETLLAWSSSFLFPMLIGVIVWMSIFVRHYLVKYVIVSNAIFVGILLLDFLQPYIFSSFNVPVYLDSFFKLPFAILLEIIVFSFAIAAKIAYDNDLRVESEKQLRETEMMVLRSQMNPHFIFNSLNIIRNFILQNDNTNANKYLSKFSKLLR